jgi:hypothetical protein
LLAIRGDLHFTDFPCGLIYRIPARLGIDHTTYCDAIPTLPAIRIQEVDIGGIRMQRRNGTTRGLAGFGLIVTRKKGMKEQGLPADFGTVRNFKRKNR